MKASYKIALGAVFMALSTIFMLATSVFPFASFAFPAIAGALLIVINLEIGRKWALLVYAGVSLLSLFVSSDHTAVISFIVFFGYYPVIKGVIEKCRKRWLEWILKLLLFNAAILVGVLLTILLFGLDILLAEYSEFGKIGLGLFVLACEVVFVVFDVALTRLITLLIYKVMPKLRRLR
ncbi:MAG: hypothetical protein IJ027_06065 [Oscillospiraceae bacterium]|nr:hypothetical protein [Oscillospiraceae bacterium]